jgi:hypothetical protein
MAFPILGRPKNPLTKQAVHLWLECSVINGFGLCHFADNLTVWQGTLAPLTDPIRRGQPNLYVIKPLL